MRQRSTSLHVDNERQTKWGNVQGDNEENKRNKSGENKRNNNSSKEVIKERKLLERIMTGHWCMRRWEQSTPQGGVSRYSKENPSLQQQHPVFKNSD